MVNFSVDGISTSNVRQNGALQDAYPSQEGISEVKVTSFNNSAEFSQVGDVTFTTKSGTTKFHGSLFEYLQNDALDADPYGFSGKAPKHFNTFGGSLGGPLIIPHLLDSRDKTFFFVDYEGNRRSTAVAEQFLVPTQDERNGDLDRARRAGHSRDQHQSDREGAADVLSAAQCYAVSRTTTTKIFSRRRRGRMARTFASTKPSPPSSRPMRASAARTLPPTTRIPLLPNDSDSIHNRSLLVSHTYTITPHAGE